MRRFFAHLVVKNAAALYAVEIANTIVPLLTVPYLARVLRPEVWGLVIYAQSFSIWLVLVAEYGFGFSATREIARTREDKAHVAGIVSGIWGAKSLLLVASIFMALIAWGSVAAFRAHPSYLLWGWLSALAQTTAPLWYFQGTENLRWPAFISVAARAAAAALTFVLVQTPEHGSRVLALQAGGGIVATTILVAWLYREITWVAPTWRQTWRALREGWSMFLFTASSSLFSSANVIILGLFVPMTQVSFFGSADTVRKAVIRLFGPLSQALYPHVTHALVSDEKRAARLAMKSLLVMGGIGLVSAVLIGALAPWIVLVCFGHGYETAIPLLRILGLQLVATGISRVLGVQWMVPLGLDKAFNTIVIASGALSLVLAFLLVPRYGAFGMAWSFVTVEIVITLAMWQTIRRSKFAFWRVR